MSLMCTIDKKCSAIKGMCIHEKMMMGVVVLGVLAAIAHWGLNLF